MGYAVQLIPCVLALIMGFILTYPVKIFGVKLGFIDIPTDDRRMHKDPIPTVGGLAIYGAFVFAGCFTGDLRAVVPYALAGAIVVALGITDDKHALTAPVKILGQTAAGAVLCLFGIAVDTVRLFGRSIDTGPAAYPLTVIFVIAVTNIYNLIDGLDGLCCGLSVIACVGLTVTALLGGLSLKSLSIALIFIFACLGFLPHNIHSARIFMGDTGAMFCGLTLAGICCQTVFSAEYGFSALIVPAIMGIPIFDTAFAIVRRLHNKTGVFVGDKKHVHHRLCAKYGHGKAVVLMYICAVSLAGIALVIGFAPYGESVGAVLLVLCAAYGIVRFGIIKS